MTISPEPWYVDYTYGVQHCAIRNANSSIVTTGIIASDAEYILECIKKSKELDAEVDLLEQDKEELEAKLQAEIAELENKLEQVKKLLT